MKLIKPLIILLILCNFTLLLATTPTIGLMKHNSGSLDDGYVLFAPVNDTTTYLIDKCGYVVHKWIGNYNPGLSVYLLPNGKLLKSGIDEFSPFKVGGAGGYIEIADWDGNVEWRYKLSNKTECQHHDVKGMPNGNILAIVWENKTLQEVTDAGRNPDFFNKEFWSEKIQELRPIGTDSAEIVWEWKAWDHLVQDYDSTKANYGVTSEHPELIDLKFPKGKGKDMLPDWIHANSIDYNSELDQILISCRFFCEFWIIDHSTTTLEAAGHEGGKYGKGGDLLYRWGNPIAYGHGTNADQKLNSQHDACWIPKDYPNEHSIMVFNNIQGTKDNRYSSVDIIAPPVTETGFYAQTLPFAPAVPIWSYSEPGSFYASSISGAQQLQNGNVLICNGPAGTFFEIDQDKQRVWEYINPIVAAGPLAQGAKPLANDVFRCTFYPSDYSPFIGKELLPIGLIENENEISENCSLVISVEEPQDMNGFSIYPNPADEYIRVETELGKYKLSVKDLQGNTIIEQENTSIVSIKTLPNGMYFVNLISDSGEVTSKKFIVKR